MGHQDEYEMLIEYSEMTTFNFNSEEFQRVRKDYIDCKNMIAEFSWNIRAFFERFRISREF